MTSKGLQMPENRFGGYVDPTSAEKRICTPCNAVCTRVANRAVTPHFGILAEGGAN